jgi:hypothetical protein
MKRTNKIRDTKTENLRVGSSILPLPTKKSNSMAEIRLSLDLTGLTLETPDNRRLALTGHFDAGSLADRMIYEGLPYFECHRCGRFDYCKFVQRLPNYPDRARDIKCGVVESVLRLFVERTFPILPEISLEQRQAYLDAAFHFQAFVFQAETFIGMYMNEDFITDKTRIATFYYGRGVVRLRDGLNRVAEKLRQYRNLAVSVPSCSLKDGQRKRFSKNYVSLVVPGSLIY